VGKWASGQVGKWGLIGDMNDKNQPLPNDQGFDYWYASHNNAMPSHTNPENFYDNGKALGKVEGYSSQIVVDHAMKWMDQRSDKSKPFLLILWFHEPHMKLGQPESFRQKYAQHKGKKGDYYANIDHLDHQIGRFITYLNKHKLRENTWITFTSDNGPKSAEYGGSTGGLRGHKSSFYEGGTRVPTIMYWKGMLEGGKTMDTPINFFDFSPTFQDLLQVKKRIIWKLKAPA
jgi:arylsulfatase A